jgi:hypothetical protein
MSNYYTERGYILNFQKLEKRVNHEMRRRIGYAVPVESSCFQSDAANKLEEELDRELSLDSDKPLIVFK